MGSPLPPEKTSAAMQLINTWRQDPAAGLACPVCGALGIEIADRSARPCSEWYILTCGSCGLDAAISIPMAPPVNM